MGFFSCLLSSHDRLMREMMMSIYNQYGLPVLAISLSFGLQGPYTRDCSQQQLEVAAWVLGLPVAQVAWPSRLLFLLEEITS